MYKIIEANGDTSSATTFTEAVDLLRALGISRNEARRMLWTARDESLIRCATYEHDGLVVKVEHTS